MKTYIPWALLRTSENVQWGAASAAPLIVARSTAWDAIPFVLDRLLAHISAEALSQATVATLVSLVLVDDTVPVEAARVQVVLAHTATEEALRENQVSQLAWW